VSYEYTSEVGRESEICVTTLRLACDLQEFAWN